MKSWFLPFFVGVGLLSEGTGCMTRVADMTAVSTRNVCLNKCDLDTLRQTRTVGESSRFMLLCIPFGIPRLGEAVDDALDKGQGDLILDAAIYQGGWWFLCGELKLQVRGNVVKTKGGPK